ncbi:hypothetical protein Tco_1494180 [Tanacetum coccineum]
MRVVVMIDSVVAVDGDGVGKIVGIVVTMAGCGGAVTARGGAWWWGSDRSVSGGSDWWWPKKLAEDGDRETFPTAAADGRNTSPPAAVESSIEREG